MTDKTVCCVCHEPVEEPFNVLGGRLYCAKHFAVVNKPHSGFWRAGVIQFIGMAIFA